MKSTSKLVARLLRLLRDRNAVSTVEYALIVIAVIVIVGAGMATLSDQFDTLFDSLGTQLTDTTDEIEALGGT